MAVKEMDLGSVVGPQGPKGDVPEIGSNGNWWIGGKDTGMLANLGGIFSEWRKVATNPAWNNNNLFYKVDTYNRIVYVYGYTYRNKDVERDPYEEMIRINYYTEDGGIRMPEPRNYTPVTVFREEKGKDYGVFTPVILFMDRGYTWPSLYIKPDMVSEDAYYYLTWVYRY